MAIKMVSRKWCGCVGAYKKEFIVDTDADFANLPEACTGSVALSIESGNMMIVNASGKWVAFAEGG